MFILLYFTEGVMRGWADTGLSRQLALAETALSVVYFTAVVAYSRLTRAGDPRRPS